jgi:two-component system phosphate regulon response regulator OmpR
MPAARKQLAVVVEAGVKLMVPGEAAKLVVVDDEPEIRGMVADYLGKSGFAVCRCANGAELDSALAAGPADLVLLDVNMPGEDGLSIARRLRASRKTPIIMLTAADDVVDRVVGLEIGADDYMTKPFDLRELRARVRAVLRRAAAGPAEEPVVQEERSNLVSFGKVRLDLDRYCLVDPEGEEHRLTATEFDLLATFARNPNRVLSRERLLDLASGREQEPFDRSIDIRITRIRKKIEVDPAKPQIIKTVRGVGYTFVPPRN